MLCMAASISLSWATVADTSVETCSITIVLLLFFSSGTVYPSKNKRKGAEREGHISSSRDINVNAGARGASTDEKKGKI